jgi:hypothetical protein
MKNIYKILFLLTLVSNFNTGYCQVRIKIQVDSLCEITFPEVPQTNDMDNNKVYYLNNPRTNYFVLVQDLTNGKISLTADSLDSFYQGTIEGVLESKSTKGRLIYQKKILIDGFKGMEFEYQSNLNPKLPDIRFNRIILLNEKLYNYSFWTFKDSIKTYSAEKERFLNSFHITANKEKIKQYNNEGLAYNLGSLFGRFLGFALTITVLFFLVKGIIVIYRKVTKKQSTQ